MSEGARYLILSRDEDVAPAKELAGSVYACLSLTQAQNGELQDLKGNPCLLWPDRDVLRLQHMRAFAMQLVGHASTIKLIDPAQAPLTVAQSVSLGYDAWISYLLGELDNNHDRVQEITADAVITDTVETVQNASDQGQRDAIPPGTPARAHDPESLAPDDPEIPEYFDDNTPPIDLPQPQADEKSSVFVIDRQIIAWPEPIDMTANAAMGRPFDPTWLPEALGAFVGDVAERMGGDCGAPAMGALAACCGLADDRITTTPKLHDLKWQERPCVWTLAVGESATKKTWLVESALKPVQKIDAALTREWVLANKDHQYAMEQYAEVRRKAIKDGLPRPPEPEPVPHQQLMVNEFTIESLREPMMESERGILVYRDEIAGLISDMDRFAAKGGGGDRYSILELHNGGQKKIGRVGNWKTVPNWSATIAGCFTPASLKASIGQLNEDGLLQRFLICNVRPAGDDIDRPANAKAESDYLRVLNTLLEQKSTGTPIAFSGAAYDIRMAFMARVNAFAKQEGIPGAMAAHLRKMEATFPRLCVLFHLIDLAVDGKHPGLSDKISGITAQRVSDLLLNWQYSHLQEFYLEVFAAKKAMQFAQVIASYILAHGVTLLSHNKHIAQPHYTRWSELSALEKMQVYVHLESMGWIVPQPGAKLNKEKLPMNSLVNPAVHTKFAARAAQERERRAAAAAAITQARAEWRAAREPGSDD